MSKWEIIKEKRKRKIKRRKVMRRNKGAKMKRRRIKKILAEKVWNRENLKKRRYGKEKGEGELGS